MKNSCEIKTIKKVIHKQNKNGKEKKAHVKCYRWFSFSAICRLKNGENINMWCIAHSSQFERVMNKKEKTKYFFGTFSIRNAIEVIVGE